MRTSKIRRMFAVRVIDRRYRAVTHGAMERAQARFGGGIQHAQQGVPCLGRRRRGPIGIAEEERGHGISPRRELLGIILCALVAPIRPRVCDLSHTDACRNAKLAIHICYVINATCEFKIGACPHASAAAVTKAVRKGTPTRDNVGHPDFGLERRLRPLECDRTCGGKHLQ